MTARISIFAIFIISALSAQAFSLNPLPGENGLATGRANPDPSNIRIERNGKRIVLNPHGFESITVGQDTHDTRNFLWVLDNIEANGVIFIREGQLHISRPLVITAFQGKILGAGMNRTTIVFRGPMINNSYVFPRYTAQETNDHLLPGWPYGFMFRNAPQNADGSNWPSVSTDLTMEQLSLTIVGRGPQQNYFGLETHSIAGAILLTDSNPNYVRGTHNRIEHFGATFRNVFVYGQGQDEIAGSNLERGIFIYGAETWIPASAIGFPAEKSANGWIETDHLPVNMVIEVSNCRFFNTLFQGFGTEGSMTYPGPGSDLETIFGLTFPNFASGIPAYPPASVRIADNVFVRVAYGTIYEPSAFFASFTLSPSGTYMTWSGNTYHEQSGPAIVIAAGQGDTITSYTQQPNAIFVEYNTINMIPVADATKSFNLPAVFIADLNALQDPIPMKASIYTVVQYNILSAGIGYTANLLEHYTGAGLAVVANSFRGSAPNGISAGASKVYGPDGSIVAILPVFGDYFAYNDFSQFTHSEGGFDVLNAPVCFACNVIQPGDDIAMAANSF